MTAADIQANIQKEIAMIPVGLSDYSRNIVIESLNFLPLGYRLVWDGVVETNDLIYNYGMVSDNVKSTKSYKLIQK